jgi:hypothetical protein
VQDLREDDHARYNQRRGMHDQDMPGVPGFEEASASTNRTFGGRMKQIKQEMLAILLAAVLAALGLLYGYCVNPYRF